MGDRMLRVGICSTYAPRACGLATFAADLESALLQAPGITDVSIIRMTRLDMVDAAQPDMVASFAPSVVSQISEDDVSTYLQAGIRANTACDVMILQHEFGIFGGEDGRHVLALLGALDIPVIVTLHTMMPTFSEGQLNVLRTICALADVITVFTPDAKRLLLGHAIVDANKVVIVPHGAPDILYAADRETSRAKLGVSDRFVLSTFGLVSPGKGLELAIEAMPEILGALPETIFVLAGLTHPGVHRLAGETYRTGLINRVAELGIASSVRWVNEFLPVDRIAELLAATDVFLTPYVNPEQIVSGVLTFALAAGCPVVSTDYRYAREQLEGGAGIIVNSRDPKQFAQAVLHYALDPQARANARTEATKLGAAMHWSTVGREIASICRTVVDRVPRVGSNGGASGRRMLELTSPSRVTHGVLTLVDLAAVDRHEPSSVVSMVGREESPNHGTRLPSGLRTQHLRRLVDGTGIVQHATGSVPLLSSGYCVDDVARLIPVARALAEVDEQWATVQARSVSFVAHAMADVEVGSGAVMHNFLDWNRTWLDTPSFGDHVGRAAWGLATVADDPQCRDVAAGVISRILGEWPRTAALHPIAYAILAQTTAPSLVNHQRIRAMVTQLVAAHRTRQAEGWKWFETRLRYDYAVFPHALISAGAMLRDGAVVELGLTTLRWLDEISDGGGHYRFVGCHGLGLGETKALSGDEQPLEAFGLMRAHMCAYQVTNDVWHRDRALRAQAWFYGVNRLQEPVVDGDGGCFDGLMEEGVNRNQGAESTLAFVAARQLFASSSLRSSRVSPRAVRGTGLVDDPNETETTSCVQEFFRPSSSTGDQRQKC